MATITKKEFKKRMWKVPLMISVIGLIIVIILAIYGIYLILQM